MDKSIYFLLYDGRSGSTLLSTKLNNFSGICVSRESAFISRIYSYPNKIKESKHIDRFINYLFKEFQFREWGLTSDEIYQVIDNLLIPYNKDQIIKNIINKYFIKYGENAKAWIIKHPPHNYLNRVKQIDQNVKFIHIIRDGRAVFNSKKHTRLPNGKMMQSNMVKAAKDWHKLNEIYFNIPNNDIIHIKYEEFVLNKDTILNDITKWLKLTKDESQITKSNTKYAKGIGDKQKSLHKNISKEVDPKIANKWKNQLKNYEILAYEILNKDALEKYGYKIINNKRNFNLLQIRTFIYLFFSYIMFYMLKIPALLRALFKNRNFIELMIRKFS